MSIAERGFYRRGQLAPMRKIKNGTSFMLFNALEVAPDSGRRQ